MNKQIKRADILTYDYKLIVIVIISTTVLILEHYYPIPLKFPRITELVYYLFIPLIIGIFLLREKPSNYGITVGNWKLGLAAVLICLSLMAIILYWIIQLDDFRQYYRLSSGTRIVSLLVNNALYMFSWEFLFRGYMLFGLEKSIGKNAIFVQAIPFALLHIGKPEFEAITCIIGGFIFGYIAYRTRSFIPCFIIHFGIYTMIVLFATYL